MALLLFPLRGRGSCGPEGLSNNAHPVSGDVGTDPGSLPFPLLQIWHCECWKSDTLGGERETDICGVGWGRQARGSQMALLQEVDRTASVQLVYPLSPTATGASPGLPWGWTW